MPDQTVRLFGIRHHGPGCARSLLRALEAMQPDCLLIEGPPDGESVLPFVLESGMCPPVALLVYAPDDSRRAAFYPFAEFSPEWQALRYGLGQSLPVRFMDLPIAHQFGLDKAFEDECRAAEEEALREAEDHTKTEPAESTEEPTPDSQKSENTAMDPLAGGEAPKQPEGGDTDGNAGDEASDLEDVYGDPLDWLGRAAGYGDGEAWWNHMVEERIDGLELFDAIREAMTTLRAEAPRRERGEREARREALREAYMRKTLRQAKKEGFQRIAVICGAWHVPALEAETPAKQDNDLLKGLPKMKVAATWTPWTYANLSSRSGYGAGVTSPAWYEHLWRSGKGDRAIGWAAPPPPACSANRTWTARPPTSSKPPVSPRRWRPCASGPAPACRNFTKPCKPRSAWATPRRCASSSVSLSWATNWGRFPKPRPPSPSSGIWNSNRKACA